MSGTITYPPYTDRNKVSGQEDASPAFELDEEVLRSFLAEMDHQNTLDPYVAGIEPSEVPP